MKTNLIKSIFTNLLFVIGVILLIFGFIKGTITATYILVFDKYPLDQYQETMCETTFSTRPLMNDKFEEPLAPSALDLANSKAKCEAQTERQRKINMATDIASSITTLISGSVLVLFFRRFIFGKEK